MRRYPQETVDRVRAMAARGLTTRQISDELGAEHLYRETKLTLKIYVESMQSLLDNIFSEGVPSSAAVHAFRLTFEAHAKEDPESFADIWMLLLERPMKDALRAYRVKWSRTQKRMAVEEAQRIVAGGASE